MAMQFFDSPGAEVKANGELSRMRSHKGNAPTLPQTKCCPLCPAKFTRTTHLHRHIRSHTNERSHRCEMCAAEFTRSDLLTRHKKTCGDPAMQRSRRKSCQACAESKVKCDLEYPCSKCMSRGKTCIFVNDPAVSRNKKCAADRQPQSLKISAHSRSSQPPSDSYIPTSSTPMSSVSPSSPSGSSPSSAYDSSPHTPLHDCNGTFGIDLAQMAFSDDLFSNSVHTTEEENAWWEGALGRSYMFGAPMYLSSDKACPISSSVHTQRDNLPDAELDHYLYLFFETFSAQLPIIHRHTWNIRDSHPLLVRAMQACGALFVKSRRALRFISDTMSTTRDVIMQEFAVAAPRQQDYLILAVSLLQTIGLFHESTALRDSSTAWHGVLVMMIRQSSAVQRSRGWSIPDLDDLQSLDCAWKDWALHETVKRGLLLSYLHDCCHCIFFDMSPSFEASEFVFSLPCDDIQWSAPSSVEWYAAVNSPSMYGPGPSRLIGAPLDQTLHALGDTRLSNSLPPQNMFTMFVLIHGILRNMYSHLQGGCDGLRLGGPQFGFQIMLHNWMQIWSRSGGRHDNGSGTTQDLPFVHDGLPFYWLAQVSLLAIQSGSASCIRGMASTRFHTMKEWLKRIRFLLRANNGAPPDLFKELMLVRQKVAADETTSTDHGLLSFFQC